MGHVAIPNRESAVAAGTSPSHAARRAFDLLVAVPAVVVLALPFAIVSALIRLTSPGGAFFRQERVGRDGRIFRLTKFRTMRSGPAGNLVTAAGDRRITTIGRFLRRTKIDELPQLLDVVRGDMALIGPRPEVPRFVALYDERERRVLAARPGLASMAQLVYPHEAASLARVPPGAREAAYVDVFLHKKVAVDLAYESRRTLLSDVLLMAEVALLILGIRPRVDRSTDREMAQTS